MATKLNVVHLGQEVFLLSAQGEVIRTMVALIWKDGYSFLNGSGSFNAHWFSFNEALSAADDHLQRRSARLRKELRSLAHRRKALVTGEYRESVASTPQRVVDPRDIENRFRTKKLKKVCVPEAYYSPGKIVYVAITPASRHHQDVYRPYPYFVLETKVTSVCFTPDGKAHYTFSTPFGVIEFFPSLEGAATKLRILSGLEMENDVPFVSAEKEESELAEIDDIPF